MVCCVFCRIECGEKTWDQITVTQGATEQTSTEILRITGAKVRLSSRPFLEPFSPFLDNFQSQGEDILFTVCPHVYRQDAS